MLSRLFFLIFFSIFLIIFVSYNSSPVKIKFLYWQTQDLNLSIVILVTLLIGVVISSIFYFVDQLKLKKIIRQKSKEAEELKKTTGEQK